MNKTDKKVSLSIVGYITIISMLAVVFWNGACNNYNQYTVSTKTYSPKAIVAIGAARATGALVFLGHEVEVANQYVVKSKWERFYLNHGKTEVIVRIVVDLKRGQIKGQCLERIVVKGWRFKKCKNSNVLRRVNDTIDEIYKIIGK